MIQTQPHKRRWFGLAPGIIRVTVITLSVGFAPAIAGAQEENDGEPTPAPSLDRARDAFQDALERIWVPQSRLTDGPQVRAAFRDAVAPTTASVVEVLHDNKTVALGGIVGPDGWVVTKATQLEGPVKVRLKDKREFDAVLKGVDRDFDLAMLKIDAANLSALNLSDKASPVAGDWVATVGQGRDPLAVGVLSVAARKIPHRAGKLGVQLEEARDGAMVAKVIAASGAEEAGVLVNDVLFRVNDKRVRTRQQLIEAVRAFSPGDQIALGVRRDGKEITLTAVLSGDFEDMRPTRSEYQNNLGSQLSKRRFGFPTAMQHDTVLSAQQCGGPIVNLEGDVVGFNLARAGRTETYAAPTEKVRALLFDLMSGKLAPK